MRSFLLPTSRCGFTLLSVLAGVALIGILTTGVVIGVQSVQRHQMEADARTRTMATATDMATEGRAGIVNNPTDNDGNYDSTIPVRTIVTAGGGQDLSLRTQIDAVTVKNTEAVNAPPRTVAVGYVIGDVGNAAWSGSTLIPPSFGFMPPVTVWPAANLVVENDRNPAGTEYRYTTDGSEPNSGSPLWDFGRSWTPWDIPAILTVAAFHPDPAWMRSASVTINVTGIVNLAYGREGGGASTVWRWPDLFADRVALGVVQGGSPTTDYVVNLVASQGSTGFRTVSGTGNPSYRFPLLPDDFFQYAVETAGVWSTSLGLEIRASFPNHAHISAAPIFVGLSPATIPMPAPSITSEDPQPITASMTYISALQGGGLSIPGTTFNVTFTETTNATGRLISVTPAPVSGNPARYAVTVQ